MSGLLNTLHDHHQQRKERREARHGRGHDDDDDDRDNHGPQHRQNQRPYQAPNDDDAPRSQSYPSQGQSYGQGRGYAPPPGPPPQAHGGFAAQAGFDRGDYATDAEIDRIGSQLQGQRLYGDDDDDARRSQSYQGRGQGYTPPPGPPPSSRAPFGSGSQGGLDRGDFASDADIDRMVSAGEFNERQTGRDDFGYGGANVERRNAYGRDDAPTGPPRQRYGESANEYDAPSGPPSGRGYQSQQYPQQGYESGYGAGPDSSNQYAPPQTQRRTQHEAPQGPPPGHGRSQGNAPAGGFSSSLDGEARHDSKYGGPNNDRSEAPRRGEAASYYNQQRGQDDRYAHLAGLAQEHGDDDPELYRRATQGLDERMQAQAKSHPENKDDDDDYKEHVKAHRKAYGNDDKGPMDANSIGLAAAMEAFKQTAAGAKSSNAPAGAFKAGKSSGGTASKPERATHEGEEAAAEKGGASRGMQDKLVGLAMAQAGKLFDKKNAGSKEDKSQDKAQAMQSAAATAMQLFAKYKTKGALDSSDMSTVMGLAMKML
ncbi:hypothetical protein EV363DRAFT_1356322 [Boletus edulis]|nr:hypothetical protein EV363DRAFT_1356322 [Boletus edulis]